MMLTAAVAVLACAPGADAAITFTDPQPYPVGELPFTVELADLNEDTRLDIVVTSLGSGPMATNGRVSVLLNRGDGTFDPAVPHPACPSAHGTAVGDFNNDQNLDVVAACGQGGGLATFTGNGDGTLDPVDLESPRYAGTYITAAQMDGDAASELVYTSNTAFTMCVNDYVGGNWAEWNVNTNNVCDDPNGPDPAVAGGPLRRANFTQGDGVDEIVTTGNASDVRIFRRSGTGWTRTDRQTGNAATMVAVPTDLQGDGDVDIAGVGVDEAPPGGVNPGRVAVLLAQAGTIDPGQAATPYPSLYPYDATAGDFDGDGLNDIAVVTSGDDDGDGFGDAMAHHGNLDGTLGAGEPFRHPWNGASMTMAAGDLDGDAKADVVMCAGGFDECAVVRATGSAPPVTTTPDPPGGGTERPPDGPPLITRLLDTVITSGPEGVTASYPTFTFETLVAGATFECRFDAGEFRACTSPHTGYNLARGPHTFEVRYVDTNGERDPTPASRSFTMGTETRSGSCTVQIPWNGAVPTCRPLTGVCPANSVCTLSGRVVTEAEDQGVSWSGGVQLMFGAAPYGAADLTSAYCTSDNVPVPPSSAIQPRPCPGRASLRHFGENDAIDSRCSASEDYFQVGGAARGPDDARFATCTVTLRIDPPQGLNLTQLTGLSLGVFLPSAGTLSVTGTSSGQARAAGRRTRRRRPAPVRPVRITRTAPGPATFTLKPTRAGKRTLRRKRVLKLSLRMTFVSSDGQRTVRTKRVTVRPPARAPKRRPIRRRRG